MKPDIILHIRPVKETDLLPKVVTRISLGQNRFIDVIINIDELLEVIHQVYPKEFETKVHDMGSHFF